MTLMAIMIIAQDIHQCSLTDCEQKRRVDEDLKGPHRPVNGKKCTPSIDLNLGKLLVR